MTKMKLLVFLLVMFVTSSIAQEKSFSSTQFLKRIENNILGNGLEEILPDGSVKLQYNLDSKTDVEKLFFGDLNATLEFYMTPDFKAPSGLRIIKDASDKSYLLEVKHISNYDEVTMELDKKYPAIGFPGEQLASITESEIERSAEHNRTMWEKKHEESLKLYKIETISFPVSVEFTDALYESMVSVIDHFDSKPEGRNEGYSVTFRCVVKNEVWTLVIKDEPQGVAFSLSGLCQEIIADAEAGKFDESKYLKQLK